MEAIQLQEGNLIQKQFFFSQQLPNNVGENFDEERKFFWRQIMQNIKNTDILNELLGGNIKMMVLKYKMLYGLTLEEYEYLISALIYIIITRTDVRTESRAIIIRLVNDLVSALDKRRLPNLSVDFNSFYEFIENYYLTNEAREISSEIGLFSQLTEINYLIKRLRHYFTDESVYKVYSIFKQKFSPIDGHVGYQILALFLKTSNTRPQHKDFFQNLTDELFEFFFYKYAERDTIPLYIIKEIAKHHPDLNWEKHYEKLFFIILRNFNNLLRNDQQQREEDRVLDTLMPDQLSGVKCILKIIPDLMVYLLPSSKSPLFHKFWSYVDRVFQLIDSVVQIQQDKSLWVGDMFKFFKYVTRAFIRKYESDSKKRKIYSLKKNPKLSSSLELQKELAHLEDKSQLQRDSDYYRFDDSAFNYAQQSTSSSLGSDTTNNNSTAGGMNIEENGNGHSDEELQNFEKMEQFMLDERCKELFLERIKSFMKKVMYMEDQGYALAKWFHMLGYFCPDDFLVTYYDTYMKIIREREHDMDYNTLQNIFLFMIHPIIENADKPSSQVGLIHLIRWMCENFKFFKIKGFIQNIDMIEHFNKILHHMPLKTYQEVFEEYLVFYPDNSEDDFNKHYNTNEHDFTQALRDLQEWNAQFFDLLMTNLKHLEFSEADECSLLPDFQNVFWQYIVQQTPQTRKQQLNKLFQKLDDCIIQPAVNAISYFLMCYSLVEPKKTMELTMGIIFPKLIRKRQNPSEIASLRSHPLYFLIENHPLKEKILEYELAITNQESLTYYLKLIENALTYSNTHILQYQQKLQILTCLCFFHEENSVFEKACDLIHTVVISIVNAYPVDLYYQSPKQQKSVDSKVFFLKKPQVLKLEEFESQWYKPGNEERRFIQEITEIYLYNVLDYMEKTYFNSPDFKLLDYKTSHEYLIDKLIFPVAEDSKHNKEFYKIQFIILATFSSLNNRVSMIWPENKPKVPIFEKFQNNYMFKEYDHLRQRLVDFILKAPSLYYQKDVFHDGLVQEMYFYVCKETFGDSFINPESSKTVEQVAGMKAFNNPRYKNQFNNRLCMVAEQLGYFYQKVDYFYMNFPYLPQESEQLFHLFFILSFSQSYAFNFFLRFHQENNGPSIDKIYHVLHRQLITILIQKTDPNYEKSYTYRLKNSTEQNKHECEQALWMILNQYKRLQKIETFSCCISDTSTFERFFQIIGFYNGLETKLYKKTFINIIYKAICIHYEDAYIINKLHGEKKQTPILKSNKYYLKNIPVFPEEFNQKNIVKVEKLQTKYEYLLSLVNKKILDQSEHWKPRVIYSILSMYLLNIIDQPCEKPQVLDLLDSFFQLSISDENINLNQLGRAGIYRILNLNKRLLKRTPVKSHIYLTNSYNKKLSFSQKNNNSNNMEIESQSSSSGEEIVEQCRPLDDFLTWHFIKKKDEKRILKQRYLGYFEDYPKLEHQFKEYELPSDSAMRKVCEKYSCSKEYCRSLLEKMFLDKNISQIDQEVGMNFDPSQTQQMDMTNTEGTFFHQLQISLAFTFDRDRKKDHSLFTTSHTIQLFDIYMKYFKKLFQALGHGFFEATKDFIKEIAEHNDSHEKSRLVGFFICSVAKWLQKLPAERWQYYLDFCVEIGYKLVDSPSNELFRDFLSSLIYACKNNDIRITEKLVEPLLEMASKLKAPGKRFRYYQILKYFIAANGIRTRKWCIKSLELVRELEIGDKKECDEISDVITDILIYVICIPLNYKKIKGENWIEGGVQKYIDEGKIFKYTDITAFERNEQAINFFRFLDEKVKQKDNEESQKIYLYFAMRMMDNLIVNRYNDLFWEFFKNIFAYLLEYNCDDINVTDILQKLAESEYPQKIASQVQAIMVSKMNNENWLTKKKTIIFLRDFLQYQSFIQNKILIPEPLKLALLDENINTSWLAITSLSDMFKIANKKELTELYEFYHEQSKAKLPRSKDSPQYAEKQKARVLSSFALMAIVLTRQEEIMEYTDEALKSIFQNAHVSETVKKMIEQFLSQYSTIITQDFIDNQYSHSQYQLSEEVITKINNYGNSYSYYA